MIGHQLKGSGAGFGLNQLSILGAALEQAARTTEILSIIDLIQQIEAYINLVNRQLSTQISTQISSEKNNLCHKPK